MKYKYEEKLRVKGTIFDGKLRLQGNGPTAVSLAFPAG